MTNFRAMCGELLEELLARPLIFDRDLINRARAALAAAPEGEGLEPTHEQISQWINANPVLRPGSTGGPMIRVGTDWRAAFADAARWGAQFRPAAPPAAPEGKGPSESDVADLFYRHMGEGSEVGFENAIAEALARWGQPAAPPAPAEGEVGELVEWLERQAAKWEIIDREAGLTSSLVAENFSRAAALLQQLYAAAPLEGEVEELIQCLRIRAASLGAEGASLGQRGDACYFTRAADMLEQLSAAAPAVGPVAVTERLPEPGVKVLAHYVNDLGKGKTVCAIWVPAKTRSDSDGDYDFTEYDEEDDTFYWPEGWYEAIENCDDWDWVKGDEGEVVYWQPLPKWPARALPLPSGEVEG